MKAYLLTTGLIFLAAGDIFAATPSELFQKHREGWSDDGLVELYRSLAKEEDRARFEAMRPAILQPVFPEEGRPPHFFDSLASYYDKNGDGRFTSKEVNTVLHQHAERYYDLLRDSQASQGPHEQLSADFRVKTWKMLQKIALLKKELESRKKNAWTYKRVAPRAGPELWDREHTIATLAEFKKRVCERSKEKTVLVKFGSTQCADCMLMEFNQGMRALASRTKSIDILKVWWGPNLPTELDALRKSEGAKSSPHFMVYKGGRGYSCGFGFTDEEGNGLEKCLDQDFSKATPVTATCTG